LTTASGRKRTERAEAGSRAGDRPPPVPKHEMNATTHALKEAVKAFTRFHDDLTVTEEQSNGGSTLAIKMTANKDDFPKLVGQDGAMVKALRSILKAIGLATGRVIYLELDEPTVGVRLPLDKFSRDAGWDVSYVSAVMLRSCRSSGPCGRLNAGEETTACRQSGARSSLARGSNCCQG